MDVRKNERDGKKVRIEMFKDEKVEIRRELTSITMKG